MVRGAREKEKYRQGLYNMAADFVGDTERPTSSNRRQLMDNAPCKSFWIGYVSTDDTTHQRAISSARMNIQSWRCQQGGSTFGRAAMTIFKSRGLRLCLVVLLVELAVAYFSRHTLSLTSIGLTERTLWTQEDALEHRTVAIGSES